jgi:Phosphoheptose isomerase
VVFALSTSGNSENVIRGIEVAMQRGCYVIGITGRRGGRMADLVPEGSLFRVDSYETSIVQEVTITVGHLVAKLAEEELFGVEGARRPKRG